MSVYEILPVLPDVPALRDRCRALAVLEAVMDPRDPFFAYAADWSETEEVALMDNGSGDDYAVVFSAAGAYARGFAHESRMSPWGGEDVEVWPGLVDDVPEVFRPYVTEPAFCDDDGDGPVPRVTVVFWREAADGAWRTGPVETPEGPGGYGDGARDLFEVLAAGTPEAYRDFAEDYHERSVDLDAIRHVFALRPLTGDVVGALNPEADPGVVAGAVAATGYPVEGRRM
ncbi:hypothetical protein [Streptomyces erythrochromogenes]|uniref:hypothetical protein n=1 Tax=Streptomyces erythrochromogenes TaxID=285574 RepID=UPI0022523AE3|nr:hypothetical protein [Streptomyces erythrochromogenes]MCX5586028.1 hypothetical protein [Streptomyces erythrochromogenes]